MKYSPMCQKSGCTRISDLILTLKAFGHMYFCARCGLQNIKETLYNRMEIL